MRTVMKIIKLGFFILVLFLGLSCEKKKSSFIPWTFNELSVESKQEDDIIYNEGDIFTIFENEYKVSLIEVAPENDIRNSILTLLKLEGLEQEVYTYNFLTLFGTTKNLNLFESNNLTLLQWFNGDYNQILFLTERGVYMGDDCKSIIKNREGNPRVRKL